jgi:TolA-binding protein
MNPLRVLGLAAGLWIGALLAAVDDPSDPRTHEPTDASRPTNTRRVSVQPLDVSRVPSTDELMAAGLLGGQLFPTHELKDQRRRDVGHRDFGKAIDDWNRHEYRTAVALFRRHLELFPDSPWAAEAALHIGCDATYKGRYSEAEAIFNQLIQTHQGQDHPGAKMLLNKTRERLARLKVEQNNLEEASARFSTLLESPDWRHRTYDALTRRFDRFPRGSGMWCLRARERDDHEERHSTR